jgi:hypothetical protein
MVAGLGYLSFRPIAWVLSINSKILPIVAAAFYMQLCLRRHIWTFHSLLGYRQTC